MATVERSADMSLQSHGDYVVLVPAKADYAGAPIYFMAALNWVLQGSEVDLISYFIEETWGVAQVKDYFQNMGVSSAYARALLVNRLTGAVVASIELQGETQQGGCDKLTECRQTSGLNVVMGVAGAGDLMLGPQIRGALDRFGIGVNDTSGAATKVFELTGGAYVERIGIFLGAQPGAVVPTINRPANFWI